MRLMPDEISDKLKEFLSIEIRPHVNIMIAQAIRGNCTPIQEKIVLWVGERHDRSALMSEILHPSEEYPEGAILLHIDAIISSCEFTHEHGDGRLASVLLHEIYRWMKLQKKGFDYPITEDDEVSARIFSMKLCKKLYNKGTISQIPKNLADDEKAAMDYMSWLQDWTKKTPEEWQQAIRELHNET